MQTVVAVWSYLGQRSVADPRQEVHPRPVRQTLVAQASGCSEPVAQVRPAGVVTHFSGRVFSFDTRTRALDQGLVTPTAGAGESGGRRLHHLVLHLVWADGITRPTESPRPGVFV